MKQWKRLTAAGLTAAMAVSLLGGCGGSDTSDQTTSLSLIHICPAGYGFQCGF